MSRNSSVTSREAKDLQAHTTTKTFECDDAKEALRQEEVYAYIKDCVPRYLFNTII